MKTTQCCFVLPYMDLPTGELLAAIRIAKHFIAGGLEVDILVPTIPSLRSSQDKSFGEFFDPHIPGLKVKPIRLTEALHNHPTRGGIELLEAIKSESSSNQYQMYHAFGIAENAYLSALIARRQNVPLLVSLRGVDIAKEVVAHFDRLQFTLSTATMVTAVSKSCLETAHLVCEFPFYSEPTYNAVDPDYFSDGCLENLHSPVIGAVGNFHADSGVQDLVNAFLRISSDNEVSLLLVGYLNSGSHVDMNLCNLIASNHYPITLTGWVSHRDIMRYIRAMDVVVCPSRMAGCPNKVLEAMHAGKAIVATRVGANTEVIQHDIDGLLVDAYDPVQMEKALIKLLQNPERRQALGKAASAKIRQQFFINREQQLWIDILRTIKCIE